MIIFVTSTKKIAFSIQIWWDIIRWEVKMSSGNDVPFALCSNPYQTIPTEASWHRQKPHQLFPNP
jgi:hypothetical protein